MSRPLVLGTRGSALALWQSRWVAAELQRRHPGQAVEERVIRTEGDGRTDAFGAGDRGVFVNAIERALLDGEIDFAVHSMKDLPGGDTPGLTIGAVPEREDPRDALVTRRGVALAELPDGARVGTGSPRRKSQLLYARPGLRIEPLRGNVDSRVGRVRDGKLDAVLLAVAGLRRLGLEARWTALDPELCLPAVGQGALAVQCRSEDERTRALLTSLDHAASRHEVVAERAFLAALGGGCLAPASAFARCAGEALEITAMVADGNGSEKIVAAGRCTPADGAATGKELAEELMRRGAGHWLEAAREGAGDGR